eukprot:2883985-Pyramimonas_sp.AAC.1
MASVKVLVPQLAHDRLAEMFFSVGVVRCPRPSSPLVAECVPADAAHGAAILFQLVDNFWPKL